MNQLHILHWDLHVKTSTAELPNAYFCSRYEGKYENLTPWLTVKMEVKCVCNTLESVCSGLARLCTLPCSPKQCFVQCKDLTANGLSVYLSFGKHTRNTHSFLMTTNVYGSVRVLSVTCCFRLYLLFRILFGLLTEQIMYT